MNGSGVNSFATKVNRGLFESSKCLSKMLYCQVILRPSGSICLCVRHTLASFSFSRSTSHKLACLYFDQRFLSRKTWWVVRIFTVVLTSLILLHGLFQPRVIFSCKHTYQQRVQHMGLGFQQGTCSFHTVPILSFFKSRPMTNYTIYCL